ncbi:hypothetical protein Dimus_005049 [Dionaea muscipula]
MQRKEKEWKVLEEWFKESEKKRDDREKEYQKRIIELKEVSTWGQKLHRENGELLKQVDMHKTLISSLSVEVEEEKRKREKAEKKSETIKELRDTKKKLKERLEVGKKKREDLVGVLNKYDGRLKGENIGKKIDFRIEPYVSYLEEYLPSHPSSAKLPNPFKFLKDWIEEEEKKDQPKSRRRNSGRKR